MKLGIDVGGTNTDAVVMTNHGKLLSWSKHLTSNDIITGIESAATEALQEANIPPEHISGVFLGTTHVLNSLYYPNNLAKTALIRMTRKPSLIEPAIQWPSNLKKYIGKVYDFQSLCDYKGNKDTSLNPNSAHIHNLLLDIEKYRIESICIAGAYSPLYETEEREVRNIIKEYVPGIPVTMSHKIGSIGFIERENAALLNAVLSKVIRQAMTDLSKLFKHLSLNCPYWLTQNDGSLMEIREAVDYPILTIGSGVSNSIRGASILSGFKSCIVVDTGGSTIDIGKIINGQPEVSVGSSSIFDIQVNVRVPQIHSMPYGGGSLITMEDESAEIKETIANNIEQQGMAWGGHTWTLTDSFLKLFPDSFQDESIQLKGLDLLSKEDCKKVIQKVTREIRESISRLQPSSGDLPVILVGGGSPLLANRLFGKYKKVLHPAGYHICNAVGACFAPLSAELDKVFWLNGITKQEVIDQAKEQLFQQLVQKGAKKESIELVSLEEFPFDYLEGEVLRVRLKALGELA